MEEDIEKLKYPIGRYIIPDGYTPALMRQWLSALRGLPLWMDNCIENLDEAQLHVPYRPGGWTIQQVVHHVADSHMNAYIRLKLALTEDNPTIKPYNEQAWAELADTNESPVNISVTMLHALHRRMIALLENMKDAEWQRTYYHPELNRKVPIWELVAMYAWHGKHHTAHITELREKNELALMKYYLIKIKRLLLQLLLLLLFYFISRCVFTFVNYNHFEGLDFGGFMRLAFHALKFDISIIFVLNSLYIFLFFLPVNTDGNPRWEKFLQFLFVFINAIAFLFELSDWTYFPFTLKRATSDVLAMISRKGDFLFLLPHLFKDFWYIPLAAVLFIAGFTLLNKRIKKSTPLQHRGEPHTWQYRLLQSVGAGCYCFH